MIWLTIKEAAELLGYEESTVRKRAKNGEYVFRHVPSSTGQGGKRIEISLESLPEQAQKAYLNKNDDSQFVINTNFISTIEQKKKGEIREQAIQEFRQFEKEMKRKGMTSKTEIKDAFVEKWNCEHPDFKRSKKTLYDWIKKKKKGESLIDKRGGHNRGQSSILPYYQQFFLDLYLQQSQLPFAVCYRLTLAEAAKNGDKIPKEKAFKKLLDNTPYSVKVRGREGKKAFEDKCMPTALRDFSALAPNELWVSDHHLWDLFVRVPDGHGGWKPARPWGSYWMDMRTRKVMSSFIRIESPNSDIVLLSFGIAVEKYGIPQEVYLDNGRDYKARDLFYPEGHMSKQDIKNEEIIKDGISEYFLKNATNSLAANLQMKVTYARPYNARAKPIERLFNTIENNFGKLYPSYAGSNAKNRPEDLKKLDIMDMPTLEEFIEHHTQYIEDIYNNCPHSGDSMKNKSPNYWYDSIEYTKRTMSSDMLYFTFMRVSRARKVSKEGIRFNKKLYLNPEYQNYVDKKVIIKHNPTAPENIYIFDLNENFLFIASERKKYGFELTDEDYAQMNHERKLAEDSALNGYKPNTKIRSIPEIGKRLEDYANIIDKIEPAEPKVVEAIRNPEIEETVRRIHTSSIDRNYEDVLKANEKIKNDSNDKQRQLIAGFRKDMLDLEKATRQA